VAATLASTSRTTMAAATVVAPGSVRVGRVPAPRPGPGQVLVRLEGSGVCGSNGPVWEGRPWFDYPLAPGAPGHEGWGRVEGLGDGVDDVAPGTRVALLSHHAFAELDVADAHELVPLPPELDGRYFPGEALGCAMNVLDRSRIDEGQSVAIVGTGFFGLLLVQLAVAAGARVTAYARRASSLELAERLGAEDARHLDDVGEEARFDRVLEAGGVQATLDTASRLVRERGVLVVAGFHQDGPRQIDLQLWNWRGLDVVNAHEREPARVVAGMRRAVDAVVDGTLHPQLLYTDCFSLRETAAALDAARRRGDGFVKALVLT
jgi:threonine dehydrogenase-like Zn-dependent dehydrogenase